MKKNQKGFTFIETLLVLILFIFVGFVGWYVLRASSSKIFSNHELAFTFKYPKAWTTSETTTDYGFYNVSLRAPGTVIKSCNGECLKSGAEISLNRENVGTQDYNGQLILMNSIDKYKTANAKYLSNEKVINLDGVNALEYDNNQASSGGTNIHGVQFFKDNVDYSFTLDSSKYSQPQYGKVFNSIISSIKFN